MPVFASGPGQVPDWCELELFEVVELAVGSTHAFERRGEKEKLIIGKGNVRIDCGSGERVEPQGANLDISADGESFRVAEVLEEVTLIRMCGRWGEETGGSGLFSVGETADPTDGGDPVDYEKTTTFDCHYHDCDEYWIVFEGRGTAVSEGVTYDVGPGDCLATGMGFHHDFPRVREPVRAVYFETTMEGQKRRGHLWNHTHGIAEPRLGRV